MYEILPVFWYLNIAYKRSRRDLNSKMRRTDLTALIEDGCRNCTLCNYEFRDPMLLISNIVFVYRILSFIICINVFTFISFCVTN